MFGVHLGVICFLALVIVITYICQDIYTEYLYKKIKTAYVYMIKLKYTIKFYVPTIKAFMETLIYIKKMLLLMSLEGLGNPFR